VASETDKPSDNVIEIPENQKVCIGWLYDGVGFSEPVKAQENTEAVISRRVDNLNKALQNYVYSIYDIGTQASFQVLYLLPTVSEKSKEDISKVWAWIQTILLYYYQCKETILAAKDVTEAKALVYNFSQFDAIKPETSLANILKELV
jgi:hypothetical protein